MKQTDSVAGALRALIASRSNRAPYVARSEPPLPTSPSPAPAGARPRVRRAPVDIAGSDPRSLANTKPHSEPRYIGPMPKTPAAAAKLRRRAMEACMCRLCALALRPPLTFAEGEALGLEPVGFNELERLQEQRRELAVAPRPYTCRMAELAEVL